MDSPDATLTAEDAKVLDLRGLVCPHVLARIVRALDERPGQDLEFLSDHATSVNVTVPAYCETHRLALETLGAEGGVSHMRIRRDPTRAAPGEVQAR